MSTESQRQQVARFIGGLLGGVSADLSMIEQLATEPYNIPAIDLSVARTSKQEIWTSGELPGVAVQVIAAPSSATIWVNRTDGPTFDPSEEKSYVHYPIRKLYLTNSAGSGSLRLRVQVNPMFLMTASGELATSIVQLKNAIGTTINPATQDTLALLATQATLATRASEATVASILTAAQALQNALAANLATFYSLQVTVGNGAEVQLAAQAVPNGFGALIHADKDNTGQIAYDDATGVTVGTHAGLKAGESRLLFVTNLNKIFVRASAAAQLLNVSVEVD